MNEVARSASSGSHSQVVVMDLEGVVLLQGMPNGEALPKKTGLRLPFGSVPVLVRASVKLAVVLLGMAMRH